MCPYEKRYEEMTDEERETAVRQYLPQVRYLAYRIHERLPRHVPLEDMVHAGIIGLIDALQKFEAAKNVQFTSYASIRIRGAILDSLRDLDWSPRELRRKARAVEEATRRLSNEFGRAATEHEIAAALSLSLPDFHQLLIDIDGLDVASLQTEYQDDDGEAHTIDVPADKTADPLAQCIRSEMSTLLAEAIEQLPDKEARVLALYHYEELTMKEVGAVLGIGESRVSQLHSMAMVRLRSRLQQVLKAKSHAA